RAQADQVLSYVHRLHQKVEGTLSEPAGVFAAGTPYSAFDPGLMLWTVAVIADSAECFYELFIGRLTDEEREALWQDYVHFAELFGMPRDAAPPSYSEFRVYWENKLASDEMFLTPEARYIGYATAFEIPMRSVDQPGKRIHDLIMLGSLPPRVRELYRLSFGRREAAAFRTAVRAISAARRIAPARLARGWNTASFERVAGEERSRIERGKPTPQVREDGPAPLPRGRLRSAA
ncbi:MAG: DUF2236 domain-containing protein, partial [Solirubrobacterales bacterium]|nr:DUF2236 domain-containing protein [Solirubrobacterales bacterium]